MSTPANRPAVTVYDFAKNASAYALAALLVSFVNFVLLVVLLLSS